MPGPNNKVVYTAIFGGYDVLHNPRNPDEEVDYVCFTDDQTLSSDVWEIRIPQINDGLPPNLKNRRIKLLPHEYLPEYDYSVYVDGNVQLLKSARPYISASQSTPFAAPTHPTRSCAYEEARVCTQYEKGNKEMIRRQIDAYESEGFPRDFGLTANRLLLRQHSHTEVQNVMNAWWNQLQEYSSRDQISLPYVLWKSDLDYRKFNEGPDTNRNRFRLHPHLPSKQPRRALVKFCIRIRSRRDVNVLYKPPYYVIAGAQKARRDGLTALPNRRNQQN